MLQSNKEHKLTIFIHLIVLPLVYTIYMLCFHFTFCIKYIARSNVCTILICDGEYDQKLFICNLLFFVLNDKFVYFLFFISFPCVYLYIHFSQTFWYYVFSYNINTLYNLFYVDYLLSYYI